MGKGNLYFVTPVWGEAFIERFCSLCLASLMSSGNFPSILRQGAYNYSYVIYTLSTDIPYFENFPVFRRLKELMPVSFRLLDDYVDHRPPLGRMSWTYHDVIKNSEGEDNTFMFPIPDMVWADAAFYNAVQISLTGKRAVLISCFRTEEQKMRQSLARYLSPEGVMSVSARQLVAAGVSSLHPTAAAKIWSSEYFTTWPSYLLWPVSGTGFYQRSFQLLPVLLRPVSKQALPRIWPDVSEALDGGEYLVRAVPNPDEIYYVDDSDQVCGLDLVAADAVSDELPDGHNEANCCEIGMMLHERLQPVCGEIIAHAQKLHAGDLNAEWQSAQAASDRAVNNILQWAAFFARCPDALAEVKAKSMSDVRKVLKTAFRAQMSGESWTTLCAMLGIKP